MATEFFEIVDYTNVTPWERLVAQLEAQLREWDLNGFSEFSIGKTRSATLAVDDQVYELSVYFARPETVPLPRAGQENYPRSMLFWMDPDLDFPHECHHLQRWFGIIEFAVLERLGAPADSADAGRLLSALTTAMDYAQCSLPHFVPASDGAPFAYIGYLREFAVHAAFEMHTLSPVPRALSGLPELLAALRLRLGLGAAGPDDDAARISLSVRYTYERGSDWHRWRQPRRATLAAMAAAPAPPAMWGPAVDPVASLHLSAAWPPFAGDLDAATFADPRGAALWTLRVARGPLSPSLMLRDAVNELLLAREDAQRMTVSAMLLLARPRKSLEGLQRSLLGRSATVSRREAPTIAACAATVAALVADDGMGEERPVRPLVGELVRQLQGAPPGSSLAALVGAMLGLGLRGVARLWHAFVGELRRRWETLEPLPRETARAHIDPGAPPSLEGLRPDLALSIVQQKVQMLNCCIHARRIVRRLVETDGDGFNVIAVPRGAAAPLDAASGDLRVGAVRLLPGARLSDGRALYVPLVQLEAPLTADLVAEQVAVWESIGAGGGAGEAGATERAQQQVQGEALSADMQAFKAANPGAGLLDFVRWYSPRDVVAGEGGGAELSMRMGSEGNLWARLWDAAAPAPMWAQRQRFNAEREAERLLSDLAALEPAQLLDEVVHAALCIAVERLDAATVPAVPATAAVVDRLGAALRAGVRDSEAVVAEIGKAEHALAVALSLQTKLPGCAALQEALLAHGAALVCEADRGAVAATFTDERTQEQAVAQTREYVLRAGRGLGRRAYACVADGELRVATIVPEGD